MSLVRKDNTQRVAAARAALDVLVETKHELTHEQVQALVWAVGAAAIDGRWSDSVQRALDAMCGQVHR